ncbi:MAG: hypothetical protein WCF03_02250 [Nitrososphaeraceae archaeon]
MGKCKIRRCLSITNGLDEQETEYINMASKCKRCEMTNFEVMTVKSENGKKEVKICNQCRPEDSAYAY